MSIGSTGFGESDVIRYGSGGLTFLLYHLIISYHHTPQGNRTMPPLNGPIHARPRNTLQRDKHTDDYCLLHTLMPMINPNCAS